MAWDAVRRGVLEELVCEQLLPTLEKEARQTCTAAARSIALEACADALWVHATRAPLQASS